MKIRSPLLLACIVTISLLIASTLTPPSASAQDSGTPAATQAATQAANDNCADFVKAALEATDKACADTGRNQACYGSISIKAEPQPGIADFQFDQPGKIVDLTAIKDLQLSALDTDTKTWGVALFRVQANLPGTVTGQSVTMLVFGDVQIQNAVTAPTTTLTMTVSAVTSLRSKPVNGSVVGRVAANDTVTATGRLKDGSWLRVQIPGKDANTTIVGWVAAKSVTGSGDINTLDEVDPAAPVYGPMQAFYFQTGIGEQSCKSAPPNGVLIQTPRGSPKVTMMINDAKVTVGSSVFVNSDTDMTFATFDGSITVEAKGGRQIVRAGSKVELPLGSDKKVSGPPAQATRFNATEYQALTLPAQHLPVPVVVSLPANQGRASGGQATFICPAGTPQTADYTNVPGIGTRHFVAPCRCANGSHTETYSQNGMGVTAQICN